MKKTQTHRFVYKRFSQEPGHIFVGAVPLSLCGIERATIAEAPKEIGEYKRWVPGRNLCPECQERMKAALAQRSALIESCW